MAAATAISRATFPIFDPIFYIKFILKNGEIWRGEGGGGGPRFGTVGALEILTQALQTFSKHLVNRSERRRNDKDSQDRRARERKALKSPLRLEYTLCITKMLTI